MGCPPETKFGNQNMVLACSKLIPLDQENGVNEYLHGRHHGLTNRRSFIANIEPSNHFGSIEMHKKRELPSLNMMNAKSHTNRHSQLKQKRNKTVLRERPQ